MWGIQDSQERVLFRAPTGACFSHLQISSKVYKLRSPGEPNHFSSYLWSACNIPWKNQQNPNRVSIYIVLVLSGRIKGPEVRGETVGLNEVGRSWKW